MASGITPIQRLQNAQQAADQWIQSNKPTQEQSEKVLNAFASRCRISGSDSFIAKINSIQKKASQMATGFNLMQRLLATGKEIVIRESEKSCFTHKTPEDTAIEIASSNIKAFYPYLNSDGERELAKASNTVTFLHEGLHALRHFEDPEAAEKRVEEAGVLPEMDTAEEELVITGNLHLEEADVVDYCCENTALREINRPPHINHRGFSNNTPNLHDFVRHRILPKVRELAASGGITNEKISDFNALELAMHLRLLETDPRALQELNEIIALLIQGGCVSEYALKIAVLENSKEHIDLLLDAGIKPTSDIFQWASKSAEERVEELAKVLTAAKLMLDIEKLLETPTVVSPSGKNPLDKIFREYDRDYRALQAKCGNDLSPPLTAIENWRPPHLRSSPSSSSNSTSTSSSSSSMQPRVVVTATSEGNPPITFQCTPEDVSPTTNRHHYRSPNCFKAFKDFGLTMQTMSMPFFRPFEIERFLSFLRPHHFQSLANDIAYEALKKTQIGYQVVYSSETPPIPDFPMACITQQVDLDHNFRQIVADLITPHLIGGFSNHSALPKKDAYGTVCYLDIPLVSEDGMGLLQQLKHSYDGKYLAAIESLKERENEPITSLTCRFRLNEHLVESGCRLQFQFEFMINGARGTTTIGFG